MITLATVWSANTWKITFKFLIKYRKSCFFRSFSHLRRILSNGRRLLWTIRLLLLIFLLFLPLKRRFPAKLIKWMVFFINLIRTTIKAEFSILSSEMFRLWRKHHHWEKLCIFGGVCLVHWRVNLWSCWIPP